MSLFKHMKNKIMASFGDPKAQGALKLDQLNKKIINEFYYFIGKTGDDVNLYILWIFFIKRVGLDKYQSIEVMRISGMNIEDRFLNENKEMNEMASKIKLNDNEIKNIIHNASVFSFRYILK